MSTKLMNTRLFGFLVLLSVVASASAATLKVPSQYGTIQAAVTAAKNGDTVLIADGTYTGIGNVNVDTLGKAITITSVDGPSKTIIDCQGTSSSRAGAFILQTGETAATVIDGLTIKDSYAGSQKSAVTLYGTSPIISNCVFTNNGGDNGGAIFSPEGGTLTIRSCTFSSNSASVGGAIYANAILNLTNCTFSNNQGTYGGAIYAYPVISLVNTTFANNVCSYGGALYFTGAGNVNGCTFTVNGAPANAAVSDGGAINASHSTLTIQNSTFFGNSAPGTGATTSNPNSASAGDGGALYGSFTTLSLLNDTFANNSAEDGAALALFSGNLTCTNDTFTQNQAKYGGALYLMNAPALTATNTIFYGNMAADAQNEVYIEGYAPLANIFDCDCDTTLSSSYDLYTGIDADPQFNIINHRYFVSAASPCLGAGLSGFAPATDEGGQPRPNPPSIGAYETAPAAPTVTGFSPGAGLVGTSVAITGTHFMGTTAVNFNGTSAAFIVDSDTSITAIVPTGATTGLITVSNIGGTGTFFSPFRVAAPIMLTSFSPSSGGVGTGASLTGVSFTGATSVTFNGTPASFTVNSDTSIKAVVPAGATSGVICVTSPGGTATSASPFTVSVSLSSVTVNPASVEGGASSAGTVTLSGPSPAGGTVVTLKSSSTSATVPASVTVPAGATSASFTITTSAVTKSTAVTVKALIGSASVSTTLTVTP